MLLTNTSINMSIETITTISPSTGKGIIKRTGATPSEMLSMARAAQAGYRNWSETTTLTQRKQLVSKALKVFESKKDEIAKGITEQMGRPIAYTAKEVLTAVKRCQFLMSVVDERLGTTDGQAEEGFRRYIKKVPLGVVLIIFPWNYPLMTLINSLVPALLVGNAVIIKPSPQTPLLAEQVTQVFHETGLPTNVLQHFHCGTPSNMDTLLKSPLINHVCFTGSVAGGLAVQKALSDRIVNVGLELGGNDPAYVRPDVNLAWAAEEIVDGAIFNSGQSCCAIERVYVHESVHDAFVEKVKKVLAGYRVGDPMNPSTQVGPVISAASRIAIMSQIADACRKGAKDVTPANASFDKLPTTGHFVRPTLLTGTNHEMVVMQQETFGPVIPVMKVKDDEEAVQLMNDSDLGLTASVWTKDVAYGEKLADRIEAGTVFVNRSDFPSPDLAWTGFKNSGKGVTLSKFGFDQFVKLKSFHVKSYPKL
ncbi:hypothetical protein KEM55_002671 [Ascosphaera atra]|nr:hypothetical protein KEM55_002671 [Ascosphaera atra]